MNKPIHAIATTLTLAGLCTIALSINQASTASAATGFTVATASTSKQLVVQAEAAKWGLKVASYTAQDCPTGAAGCSLPQNWIEIDARLSNTDDEFRDYVRHEAAHIQIYAQCGTFFPIIIGPDSSRHPFRSTTAPDDEFVTDAYARLYDGMVSTQLGYLYDSQVSAADRTKWTNLASQIHAGFCAAEGSFVAYQGHMYRIAGGAPTYVSSLTYLSNVTPSVTASADQWIHLRQYPKNGTVVIAQGGGGNHGYVFAGGAALYVSNWSNIGGMPANYVYIDEHAIISATGYSTVPNTNSDSAGTSIWSHINKYSINGTVVVGNSTTTAGNVFVFAGGAPMYVSSFASIGGQPANMVSVDRSVIVNAGMGAPNNVVQRYPVNGTILRAGPSGSYYSVSNGAAVNTTTTAGAVVIDPANITNHGQAYPWGYLK